MDADKIVIQKPWKADPRLPIMRRPCADRGENHDPADARHTRGLQNRLTQKAAIRELAHYPNFAPVDLTTETQ